MILYLPIRLISCLKSIWEGLISTLSIALKALDTSLGFTEP